MTQIRTVIGILCLLAFFACTSKVANSQTDKAKQAVELQRQALAIYMRNVVNVDSLDYASKILDSAIKLWPNTNFYYSKYSVLKREKQFQVAITVCDTILAFDTVNYVATLHKGYLYEELKMKDSATKYYKVALSLLYNGRSFKADSIVKDREEIILDGLLNDSTSFTKNVATFTQKYASSQSQWYNLYLDEFLNFDRLRYVLSE